MYLLSVRLGFEQTRHKLTFVFQKFFAAFSRVHGDGSRKESLEMYVSLSSYLPLSLFLHLYFYSYLLFLHPSSHSYIPLYLLQIFSPFFILPSMSASTLYFSPPLRILLSIYTYLSLFLPSSLYYFIPLSITISLSSCIPPIPSLPYILSYTTLPSYPSLSRVLSFTS